MLNGYSDTIKIIAVIFATMYLITHDPGPTLCQNGGCWDTVAHREAGSLLSQAFLPGNSRQQILSKETRKPPCAAEDRALSGPELVTAGAGSGGRSEAGFLMFTPRPEQRIT